MSNTSQHIPFESVAPIMLESSTSPDYPFLSGTGFFLQFPPYEDIFFVTAKHCILDSENEITGTIKIPYENGNNKAVIFSGYLTTNYINDDDDELEDVIVYIIEETDSKKKNLLKERSLNLTHQDNVDFIINTIIKNNENIRTVGFPSVSKGIDYSKQVATSQPRGFYGKVTNDSTIKNRYKINELSWKEGGLEGFSGSPILSLHPDENGNVHPMIIGMLLTGSSTSAWFISINVVTDLIAKYIKQK